MHITIAYIDPGSGAMLLQWIIAAVLGSLFAFRKWIRRLLIALMPRRFRPVAPPEPAATTTADQVVAEKDTRRVE